MFFVYILILYIIISYNQKILKTNIKPDRFINYLKENKKPFYFNNLKFDLLPTKYYNETM